VVKALGIANGQSSMSPEEKKIPAKDALLIAAEKLFTEKGYGAVSTRELADEAGVNLGAIQYHFGSKEQLFVDTIRRLMSSRCSANQILLQSSEPGSREAAIKQLATFFDSFIQDICNPCGPNVCKLMYREVLDSSSTESAMFEILVSSVVNEFIRPVDEHLQKIVKLLRPNAESTEVDFIIHSIIGQCSFYLTHRPFVERLRNRAFTDSSKYTEVSYHILQFTLRGLGVSEAEICQSLDNSSRPVVI